MKMMTMTGYWLLLLTLIFCSSSLSAEDLFEGELYLQGTNRGQLLFRQKNSKEVKGDTVVLRHIYTGVDGSLAALEEVTFIGGSFSVYRVEMPGTRCGCRLDRREESVVFTFTRENTDKKGEARYTDDLVTGPTLTDFIVKNWDSLAAGRTVFFKLPAMNLQRVAEFQLSRERSSPYAREGVYVFRMKIANMLLRLFVDPVDLVFDVKTKRVLQIHGKSLLQRRVNDKIENPVVDIYYRYR